MPPCTTHWPRTFSCQCGPFFSDVSLLFIQVSSPQSTLHRIAFIDVNLRLYGIRLLQTPHPIRPNSLIQWFWHELRSIPETHDPRLN